MRRTMRPSARRRAFGTLALATALPAAAAAAPEPLRPPPQASAGGAWITAADVLPEPARRHPALASLRLAPARACGTVTLDARAVARRVMLAWPGRYAPPTGGTVTVAGPQGARDAGALLAALQEALALACGPQAACAAAAAPPLPACLPPGRIEFRTGAVEPGGVRVRLLVDGAPNGEWTQPVERRAQAGWRLRHEVAGGDALRAEDLEPAAAAADEGAARLHYDAAAGVVRADAPLAAGAWLPAAARDFVAAARDGQTVDASVRVGRTRVWRPAALGGDARPGRAAWAALADGQWLPLRAPVGSTTEWEALP